MGVGRESIQKDILMLDLGNKRVILGSASPRRRELLSGLDIDFTVDTENNFEEDFKSIEDHRSIPLLMSEGKSAGFHRELEDDEILITSDTVVLCDGDVLGKPADREGAVEMLEKLSGNLHEVVTAVTIRSSKRKYPFRTWQKSDSDNWKKMKYPIMWTSTELSTRLVPTVSRNGSVTWR